MKKNLLSTTALTIVFLNVFAQAPSKQWDFRFGGSSPDEQQSVRQTSDGGYILGGRSSSGISGDKTQASQGSTDYWIVKTNGAGVKQWDATFGGTGIDDLKFQSRRPIMGGPKSFWDDDLAFA